MQKKLFTPLNLGAFELRHRLVADRGRHFERLDGLDQPDSSPSIPFASGGLVIFDPEPIFWLESEQSDESSRVWRERIKEAKSSRQSVLTRLRGDACFQALDAFEDRRRAGFSIDEIIDGCAAAARRAKLIGFDGIELDGTFGSVTDILFVADTHAEFDQNQKPLARRMSFVVEIVEALIDAFGHERVGIRLSPFSEGLAEKAGSSFYDVALKPLHDLEIAYVHLADLNPIDRPVPRVERLSRSAEALRQAYPGILIASSYRNLPFAIDLVESRWADAVSFTGFETDSAFLEQVRRAWLEGKET